MRSNKLEMRRAIAPSRILEAPFVGKGAKVCKAAALGALVV